VHGDYFNLIFSTQVYLIFLKKMKKKIDLRRRN